MSTDRTGFFPEVEGCEPFYWDDDSIARYWSQMTRLHSEVYFAHQVGPKLVAGLRRHLRSRGRIFDFGAGDGFMVGCLLAAGYEVGAHEPSPEGATRLERRFAGQKGFLGSIPRDCLSEHAGTFDAVFLTEVVEHLYDDAIAEAFRATRALLKPGGRLIVTTPNDEDLRRQCVVSPESGKVFHRWQHVRSWTDRTLTTALRNAGFDIERVMATNILAWGLDPKAIQLRIYRRLRGLKPGNLIVVARRPDGS